ncbi:MAG: endo alpha-1,4 polygalactosaminidase [Chthoniobacterales bacterium]
MKTEASTKHSWFSSFWPGRKLLRRRCALVYAAAFLGAGTVLFAQSVAGIAQGFDSSNPDLASGWQPLSPGNHWQWQLSGQVKEKVLDGVTGPKMYDIDMEGATPALISRLQGKNIYVVCYVESGDWNRQRPDAGDYAPQILGRAIAGFPDERFININAVDGPRGPTGKTLRDIMLARLDRAQAKGCDGIEPDLDDLHNYRTGFVINQADQVAFNTMLIDAAHARGMSMGLKNGASGSTGPSSFEYQMIEAGADWALNEECRQYNECIGYTQFIAAGKAVFQVEYLDNQRKPYRGRTGTCAKDNAVDYDGIVKDSSSSLAALPLIQCR